MGILDPNPDPDWYLDHVLVDAEPGGPTAGALLPIARWQRTWQQAQADLDPRLAGQCRGLVVRSATARRLVGDAELRRRVRRGEWSRPTRAALAPVRLPATGHDRARCCHVLRATGALLGRPCQVISARSAAVVHGLPTLHTPGRPELTAAPARTAGRHGRALVRSARLVPSEVTTWFGADITTVARTVVDLARHDRRDGLMAADAALREHLVTRSDLDSALDTAIGWPGVRAAREVVALASPLAESPLESLVRLALHHDRFPPPQLQVRIAWYRVDLAWPVQRVIIEADGRIKYVGDELWREKRREHELRRRGYTVIRVLWSDLLTGWPVVRQMLATALAAASPRG